MSTPGGYFVRWIGPWRITETYSLEYGTEQYWVRWYEEEPHCDECPARGYPHVGPKVESAEPKYQTQQQDQEEAMNVDPTQLTEPFTMRVLLGLIDDLTDSGECSFDHHGYCQGHCWFETNPPCPHGRAKRLLNRWQDTIGFTSHVNDSTPCPFCGHIEPA